MAIMMPSTDTSSYSNPCSVCLSLCQCFLCVFRIGRSKSSIATWAWTQRFDYWNQRPSMLRWTYRFHPSCSPYRVVFVSFLTSVVRNQKPIVKNDLAALKNRMETIGNSAAARHQNTLSHPIAVRHFLRRYTDSLSVWYLLDICYLDYLMKPHI